MVLHGDASIVDTGTGVERHRETFGRMEEIGVTGVAFAPDFSTRDETHESIDGFAATYLGAHRI